MKTFISHQSALEYWRISLTVPQRSSHKRSRISLPDNLPAKEQAGISEQTLPVTLPLHIMLKKQSTSRLSKKFKQHIFTGKTPEGCFINIDDSIFVSSPEFCFLQMANKYALLGLIELGYELCGSYSMPAARTVTGDSRALEKGFYDRQPLTNTKKLESFLSRMSGIKGHQNAMRALRYILDGSGSPMETKLSMFLTLPYKLGGFGFPKPELNKRIILSKADKRVSDKSFYICDLFWTDYGLAVEYDSEQYHSGRNKIAEDSKKRNSLAMIGVIVITVTKTQIFDSKEFEKVIGAISKRLRKRLRINSPKFNDVHNELRGQLLYE